MYNKINKLLLNGFKKVSEKFDSYFAKYLKIPCFYLIKLLILDTKTRN